VTAVETEDGRHWAEARIKALTGGDKIAARLMRQDFFEFTPQFKLVIVGNHKPSLRSVDEAIKRRFHMIPFAVTIPPDERDADLGEKLNAEGAGILEWMIDGCLKWQRIGLMPPKAVTEATAAYLEAEDAMSAWLAERCQRGAAARQKTSDLYASWSHWAQAAGEQAGARKRFVQALETRGFHQEHTNIGNCFFGLSLRPQMTGSEP
jgi:putative DNA primase/helicase